MKRDALLVSADTTPRVTTRFGPVLLRFTFHLSRLTPFIKQLQRRGKALRPTLAEHVLKLST
jgi:hypothetical protein